MRRGCTFIVSPTTSISTPTCLSPRPWPMSSTSRCPRWTPSGRSPIRRASARSASSSSSVGAGFDFLLAVLLEDRQQLALADVHGAPLRPQVARLVAGGPGVGDKHVEDVVAVATLLADLDRRNPQALGEDVPRVGVVAARRPGRRRPPCVPCSPPRRPARPRRRPACTCTSRRCDCRRRWGRCGGPRRRGEGRPRSRRRPLSSPG